MRAAAARTGTARGSTRCRRRRDRACAARARSRCRRIRRLGGPSSRHRSRSPSQQPQVAGGRRSPPARGREEGRRTSDGCGGGDHGPRHDSSGPAPNRGPRRPSGGAARPRSSGPEHRRSRTVRPVDERRIVAMGGGGFSMEPDNPLLDDFVLSLARRTPARVCFVGTASGDAPSYVAEVYRAFGARGCLASDIGLFERRIADLGAHLLAQDVVYVGGGNTASLLAAWRAHGLDRALIDAWHAGVVLCGISAGMNCWFEQSVTDSFDLATLAPLDDGVGVLAGSACPHYDGEEQRPPTYRRLVSDGVLRDGWAADDGAALVFAGAELAEVVASLPDAAAYRVQRTVDGVDERRVEARALG